MIVNGPIIQRLSILKQRLIDAKGEEVRRIAGVDLYHLLEPRIKKAWQRRLDYYENLSKDAAFFILEDSARDTAQELATVALSISKKLSPEWAAKFSDWLFPISDFAWEDEDTLEQKLQHCLNLKNYYSIRQVGENNLASYPMNEGIYHNCNRILHQHQELYKHCQNFGNYVGRLRQNV